MMIARLRWYYSNMFQASFFTRPERRTSHNFALLVFAWLLRLRMTANLYAGQDLIEYASLPISGNPGH